MNDSRMERGQEFRWCVVAPVYNNARTVAGVVESVRAFVRKLAPENPLEVIVVNDGSTDGTAQAIETVRHADAGVHVVAHEVNRGKAAALRTGFAYASELGFTHAITIDTDGQHDVTDVQPLLERSKANPAAMILGVRTVGKDYPFKSWGGRVLSNWLVWLIGGVRVSDSQCGLRVYPIHTVRELEAQTSRYAFETEVLARAGWAGVPLDEVVIRCIYEVPGGRVSHFQPWADSWSALVMHHRLLIRSLLTWRTRKLGDDETGGTILERLIRWMNPLRTWRQVRVDPAERDRLAASMGWGVVVGYSPFFGIKTILCLVLSKIFRLQPLVVIGTSSLASPPMGAVVWAMSIAVGHLVLHGAMPGSQRYDFAAGPVAVFRQVAVEWLVGATVCGVVLGIATWFLVRTATRRIWGSEPARVRESEGT